MVDPELLFVDGEALAQSLFGLVELAETAERETSARREQHVDVGAPERDVAAHVVDQHHGSAVERSGHDRFPSLVLVAHPRHLVRDAPAREHGNDLLLQGLAAPRRRRVEQERGQVAADGGRREDGEQRGDGDVAVLARRVGEIHEHVDERGVCLLRVLGDDVVVGEDVALAGIDDDPRAARRALARRDLSTRKIEEELPAVLSFSEQPNVEPGDVFVFKSELVNGEDLPKVYLRVVSTPIRGKKGDWRVNYMKVGFDTDEYLAKSTGYTENPLVAIDDLPVAPKSWQDAGVGERELRRQMDRKEVLKQEDEILKAAARLRQVGKQSSRKGRDLTFMLKDIYDRLAEEERELRKAA
mgnify:CR=1 FL=1